jgi:hypothetical protein
VHVFGQRRQRTACSYAQPLNACACVCVFVQVFSERKQRILCCHAQAVNAGWSASEASQKRGKKLNNMGAILSATAALRMWVRSAGPPPPERDPPPPAPPCGRGSAQQQQQQQQHHAPDTSLLIAWHIWRECVWYSGQGGRRS